MYNGKVGGKIALPCDDVHIGQLDFYFSADGRYVFIIFILNGRRNNAFTCKTCTASPEFRHTLQCILVVLLKPTKRQPECFHRTFQTLEQVGGHESLQTPFTVRLTEHAFPVDSGIVHLGVLLHPTRQHIRKRRIHTKCESGKLAVNAVEVGHIFSFRQRAAERKRLTPLRKHAYVPGVIKSLNMLAGTRYSHAVQQVEEVEVQRIQNSLRRAFFRRQLRPGVECSLRPAEYFLHASGTAEFLAQVIRISFIGQGELIAQIGKTVVHRRCRKHEHPGLHAFAYDLVHESLIPGFMFLVGIVVAEVVRLVDDHKIVVAPVHLIQRNAEGFSAGA